MQLSLNEAVSHIATFIKGVMQDGSLFVSIDGHSAAGKSTLAASLSAALSRSVIIAMDDFYRPMEEKERFQLDAREGYALYYDWQRLETEVLRPLSHGKTAEFGVYDWERNTVGQTKRVDPERTIIVEGCYSARPELQSYFDIIIFVDSPSSVRARRQANRNDASPQWLSRWDAAERYYIRTTRLRDRAHFTVL